MNKSKHTTKKGPGRRHVEGTYRNGHMHFARAGLPHGNPGDKMLRASVFQRLGMR